MGFSAALNMRVPLKYICEDVDRHGNVRCYVRLPGKRKVRIRALPGTPQFMEEYQAAVATVAEAPLRQAEEAKKGTGVCPNPNSSAPIAFTIATGSSNIYVLLGTTRCRSRRISSPWNSQSNVGAKVTLVTLQAGVG
jgi:hypothetical protein